MRKIRRFVVPVVAVAALGVIGFAGVASAGAPIPVPPPAEVAPLTVEKTVSGPVPAGTTFTAEIKCDGAIIDTVDGPDTDLATVTFAADGQSTSDNTVTFSEAGSCVVSETVDGGASTTTYSCVGEVVEADEPEEEPVAPGAIIEPDGPICATDGPQADPITVNIEDKQQVVTVTIANTFAEPKVAPIVAAAPAFTG